MHILGVDQRSHRKKRTIAEKVFIRINTIVLACQLATLAIGIGLLANAAAKSMSNSFWTQSELHLSPSYLFYNCSQTYTTSNSLFNSYTVNVDRFNIQFFVSRAAYNLRRVIGLYAALIGVGALNKLFFDINIHYVQVLTLHFRKDILSTVEVCLLIITFIQTKFVERENKIIDDYVHFCPSMQIVEGGTDASNLFQAQVPMVAFYVGLAVTAASLFFAIAAAIINMWVPHEKDKIVDARHHRRSVYGGGASLVGGFDEDAMFAASGGYQLSEDDQNHHRLEGGDNGEQQDVDDGEEDDGVASAGAQVPVAPAPQEQFSGAVNTGGVDRRW
jgi:hypothetical protein